MPVRTRTMYSSDEESDDDGPCPGPLNPFNDRDWFLHERYHQIREGTRNVGFHGNARYPRVMVVTKSHRCPISCFRDERYPTADDDPPDETKLYMTCHVATVAVANYRTLGPPEVGDVQSPADYVVKLKAAFEPKKTEIREEVNKAKRQPGIEDININLRVVTTLSTLTDRQRVTGNFTQSLTTRNLAGVEETVDQLFDECVGFLIDYIDNYCQVHEPRCSFSITI